MSVSCLRASGLPESFRHLTWYPFVLPSLSFVAATIGYAGTSLMMRIAPTALDESTSLCLNSTWRSADNGALPSGMVSNGARLTSQSSTCKLPVSCAVAICFRLAIAASRVAIEGDCKNARIVASFAVVALRALIAAPCSCSCVARYVVNVTNRSLAMSKPESFTPRYDANVEIEMTANKTVPISRGSRRLIDKSKTKCRPSGCQRWPTLYRGPNSLRGSLVVIAYRWRCATFAAESPCLSPQNSSGDSPTLLMSPLNL